MLTKQIYKLTTDSHFKELLKGTKDFFSLRILGFFVSYIFTLIVTRGFGPEAMGIYALSFTLLNIFAVFGKMGLDVALVRFISEFSSYKRWTSVKKLYARSLKLVITLGILLSIILFLFSYKIAHAVFGKDYMGEYIRIASLGIVPFTLVSLNSQSFRGLKKIKSYTFFGLVLDKILAIFVIVLFYFTFREQSAPLICYIISITGAAILSYLALQKKLKAYIKTQKYPNKAKIMGYKELLKTSTPMFLMGSFFLLLNWTDTVMLGMFRSEGEIGIYNVAVKIASVTTIILSSINSIAAPKFAEVNAKRDLTGFKKIVKQSTRLIFWSSTPILIILLLFPDTILSIFGKEFVIGSSALVLLTCGAFINSLCGSVANILVMTGYQNAAKNIILGATLINITLNYLLIPTYGIEGAAFASMISTSLWNFTMVFYIYKKFGFWTLYLPRFRSNRSTKLK